MKQNANNSGRNLSDANAVQNRAFDKARLLFPENKLQFLNSESIIKCQSLLGHGNTYGEWETPQWLVGRYICPALAKIVFRDELIKCLPEGIPVSTNLTTLLDLGELWIARYCLLLRLGPSSLRKGMTRSLDATTIISILTKVLPLLLVRGIENRLKHNYSGEEFLGSINFEEMSLICLAKGSAFSAEWNRLTMLVGQGYWYDCPKSSTLRKTTNPKGDAVTAVEEKISSPYLPIPDHYLAQMGPGVLWITQDLGPEIISLGKEICEISSLGSSREFSRRVVEIMSRKKWCDSRGRVINEPPCFFILKVFL